MSTDDFAPTEGGGFWARQPPRYVTTVLHREGGTTTDIYRSLDEALARALKFTNPEIKPEQYEKVTVTDRKLHKVILDLDLWHGDL